MLGDPINEIDSTGLKVPVQEPGTSGLTYCLTACAANYNSDLVESGGVGASIGAMCYFGDATAGVSTVAGIMGGIVAGSYVYGTEAECEQSCRATFEPGR